MSSTSCRLVAVVAVLTVFAARPLPARAGEGGPQGVDEEAVARAVSEIGHAEFAVRQRASEFLVDQGPAVLRWLKRTIDQPDPEVRARVVEVVRSIACGVDGTTPDDVRRLATGFRREHDPRIRVVVLRKLAEKGAPGVRAVRALALSERDGDVRRDVFMGMGGDVARDVAGLIAAGGLDRAEALLWAAAGGGEARWAADLAAFLLVRDGLSGATKEADAWLEFQSDPVVAAISARLHRAAGDLPRAVAAAENVNDERLLASLLAEAGDWSRLAEMAAQVPPGRRSAADWARLAAYVALAGDERGMREAAANLLRLARDNSDREGRAVMGLMFCGRMDEAAELLASGGRYGGALALRMLQGRFEEAHELDVQMAERRAEERRAEGPKDAGLRSDLVLAWQHLRRGRMQQAQEALARAASRTGSEADPMELLSLGLLERRAGLEERGAKRLAAALDRVAGQRAGFRAAAAALRWHQGWDIWWRLLQGEKPDLPPEGRLRLAEDLLAGKMPADEFRTLARKALDMVGAPGDRGQGPPGHRNFDALDLDALLDPNESASPGARTRVQLECIGEACLLYGEVRMAAECFDGCYDRSNESRYLRRAGLALADAGLLRDAAARFSRAWEDDPRDAASLYLWGWIADRQGLPDPARQRKALARLVPLGSTARRIALVGAAAIAGDLDAARREWETILLTCPGAWSSVASQALELAIMKAEEAADYERAERLGPGVRMGVLAGMPLYDGPEPYWWAIAQPGIYRILRDLAAGNVAAARVAARRSIEALPGEIEAAITLVTGFDRHGEREFADELFARAFAVVDNICAEFPGVAVHHNNLAWMASRCGRRLDEALEHAQTAVGLERDAAYLDTLADVHFMRGQVETAIALEQEAIGLEESPFFYWQLARFRAGLNKDR